MKVGIQLYSVRNHIAQDPIATIKTVAAEGYRYLEAVNYNACKDCGVGFGVPAKEIKQVLDGEGARIISAHIFPMDSETLGPVLEYHRQIGTKYVVMPMDFYQDREEVLRKAEGLNKAGRQCADAGMTLLYHNHFHEFQIFDKTTIIDLILIHTDPALVKLELDTYWAMRGGQDPVALLKKYGERVRLIHQKDFPAEYKDEVNLIDAVNQGRLKVDMQYFESGVSDKAFTEAGAGIMDIQKIINAGNVICKSEYIILEQDYSLYDEIESIRISMKSFKKFKGIVW
ncbi:MAG: sugar phosphate isomerase/epimerase [Treponema sp.]|jgi:sugar phosphate isomerase/epimerase|nr:sugar phosphate isomerase/epimerase [Treponema sp.]